MLNFSAHTAAIGQPWKATVTTPAAAVAQSKRTATETATDDGNESDGADNNTVEQVVVETAAAPGYVSAEYLLVRGMVDWLSLVLSFGHHQLSHSLTHSLTHSFTHSLTYLLLHRPRAVRESRLLCCGRMDRRFFDGCLPALSAVVTERTND